MIVLVEWQSEKHNGDKKHARNYDIYNTNETKSSYLDLVNNCPVGSFV